MGTSTGVSTNHGTSAVAIANHDYLSQETFTEIKSCPETSEREADGEPDQKTGEEECAHSEHSALQTLSGSKAALEQMEKRGKAENIQDQISLSESVKRVAEGRQGTLYFILTFELGHVPLY